MKKTGKAGLGHLKKTEKMSRRAASGRLRLALAAAAVSKNAERKARRRLRVVGLFIVCAAIAGGMERSAPSRIFFGIEKPGGISPDSLKSRFRTG